MKNWEYKVFSSFVNLSTDEKLNTHKNLETQLNKQGNMGWELVSGQKIATSGTLYITYVAFLKRPIEN